MKKNLVMTFDGCDFRLIQTSWQMSDLGTNQQHLNRCTLKKGGNL